MSKSRFSVDSLMTVVGFSVAIIGIGAVSYLGLRETPATELAADEVRIFFRTVDQRPAKNAWMGLNESTKGQFPLERFETLVQTHPAFGPFESFDVDPDYSGDGSDISGDLRVTGETFHVMAIVDQSGEYPTLVDVQVDGGWLFGVSDSASGPAEN